MKAKQSFLEKNIKKLRHTKPHQWYSTLKYLTNFDQLKREEPIVENIKHLSDSEQEELIVDKLARVGNSYNALNSCDVQIPVFSEKDIPQVSQFKVRQLMEKIRNKQGNSEI